MEDLKYFLWLLVAILTMFALFSRNEEHFILIVIAIVVISLLS
jgi:hypothetical protein